MAVGARCVTNANRNAGTVFTETMNSYRHVYTRSDVLLWTPIRLQKELYLYSARDCKEFLVWIVSRGFVASSFDRPERVLVLQVKQVTERDVVITLALQTTW